VIEAFESNPNIQSMCGVAPGSTEANFSKRGLQPIDIKIIAHELNSTRSMAVVDEVDLSNNRFDPSLLTDIEHVKLNLTGCSP